MAKTVLVTGGTGLLGRQMVNGFEKAGWNVCGTGFSRASPPRIVRLDILDAAAVSSFLNEVKYISGFFDATELDLTISKTSTGGTLYGLKEHQV
jgi:nucleoside-diphosphate-sugar epimerase